MGERTPTLRPAWVPLAEGGAAREVWSLFRRKSCDSRPASPQADLLLYVDAQLYGCGRRQGNDARRRRKGLHGGIGHHLREDMVQLAHDVGRQACGRAGGRVLGSQLLPWLSQPRPPAGEHDVELRATAIDRGVAPQQPRHPQGVEIAKSVVRDALKGHDKKASFAGVWQFRLLLIGALFFIMWRIAEMYRLTAALRPL